MTLWVCERGHLYDGAVIVPVDYRYEERVRMGCASGSRLDGDWPCDSRLMVEVSEPVTAAAYRLGGLVAAEEVWWPHGRSRWLHGGAKR